MAATAVGDGFIAFASACTACHSSPFWSSRQSTAKRRVTSRLHLSRSTAVSVSETRAVLGPAAVALISEADWRSVVAKEHNRPAFVVFHVTTLAEMARRAPGDLAALGEIGGVGAKKLEAYGREILRVLEAG